MLSLALQQGRKNTRRRNCAFHHPVIVPDKPHLRAATAWASGPKIPLLMVTVGTPETSRE